LSPMSPAWCSATSIARAPSATELTILVHRGGGGGGSGVQFPTAAAFAFLFPRILRLYGGAYAGCDLRRVVLMSRHRWLCVHRCPFPNSAGSLPLLFPCNMAAAAATADPQFPADAWRGHVSVLRALVERGWLAAADLTLRTDRGDHIAAFDYLHRIRTPVGARFWRCCADSQRSGNRSGYGGSRCLPTGSFPTWRISCSASWIARSALTESWSLEQALHPQ